MKKIMAIFCIILIPFACKTHKTAIKDSSQIVKDSASLQSAKTSKSVLDNIVSLVRGSKENISITNTETTEENIPVFRPDNNFSAIIKGDDYIDIKGKWRILTDSLDKNKFALIDVDSPNRVITGEHNPATGAGVANYTDGKTTKKIPFNSETAFNAPSYSTKKTTKTTTLNINRQDSSLFMAHKVTGSFDSAFDKKDTIHTEMAEVHSEVDKKTTNYSPLIIPLVIAGVVIFLILYYIPKKNK